ncbi:dTDP-glucose 4,6-dehydratase [Pelagibacteraceae bacterium]|jgi:dTDP-glucose 4,6-dehydratase|nr:dTDP-glucose 4,6-dehydratase [Pelagibacteraceae bacterium]|tara:strand:- start:4605 stop:5633 length:1029 start_codon:yes stop_codon:yes gene_type:complete
MKKFVITGGSGFIGSNLINFLLKKNFLIINIDKGSYTNHAYNINLSQKDKYFFFKTDINNKSKVFNILKRFKPDGIFNLAAETHVDRSIDNPSEFIKSNILGVYNLLENIRDYKKKFKKNLRLLHVSTDEVYGDIDGKKRSNENYSYNPSSPYSATKASSDHLIKSYVRTYGVKAVISNCCNNYGPGQFPEKLLPTLIFNILNNKPLPIYGKGKNSREWIHVSDHCEALLKIFSKGKIGESYNVGTNNNLTNIILAKKLLNIVKHNNFYVGKNVKIKFVKDRPGHDFRYALESKKIKNFLKWRPKISLQKGLSDTFNWYYNNKKFFNSFSKKKFYKRIGLKK